MHSEGLASLVESLSAYARIHNTQGCQRIIQRLVQEVAKMPLQEMHRFLKQLVSELQRIQDLSEWLLKTLWDEFAAVLGNRIPKVLRDLFAKLIQS
jgi:Trm5-related predicted tRNA methylase